MAHQEQYSVQRILCEGAAKAPIRFKALDIPRWSLINFAKGYIGQPLEQLTEDDIKHLYGYFTAGNPRSPQSLAEAINFCLESFKNYNPKSLHEPTDTLNGTPSEMGEAVADTSVCVENEAITNIAVGTALHSIKALSQKQQNVIGLYYFGGCSQKEIGENMGVTPRRVGQIQAKALNNLREFMTTGAHQETPSSTAI